MMKNTLKPEENFLKTKLWQNLQTVKFLKKIYSCIAAICVDSVIKLEKENYPQVNLEQCKFRLKKKKDIDLFDYELEDSSDESEIEAE